MTALQRYARVVGSQIEAIGGYWAAYSPLTGETAVLNDESAAILEILEAGPADTQQLCKELATDSGQPAEALEKLVDAAWITLREAGLVMQVAEPATIGR